MRLIDLSILALAAVLLSFLGVGRVRHYSTRKALLDIPNRRSSHTTPTPRGGGLAIVVVVAIGLIGYTLWQGSGSWRTVGSSLLGISLIAGVGWIDDVRSLPAHWRFGIHSLSALLILFSVGIWARVSVPLLGPLHLGWAGLPISFFWIVGLTNAYNFMDGIDGIAGGQAVVAGIGWTLLGGLSGQPVVEVLGLLLAAGSVGFLGHNWPPARIFMGDVGSGFLGYTFAILPVIAAQEDARLALAGALLVWPFVFDALFTFLRRLRQGENVLAAHRSHLYQRLVIIGCSHRFVSLLYGGLALTGLVLALDWYTGVTGSAVGVVLTLPALCLGLWVFVVRRERKRTTGAESPAPVQAGSC